MHCAHLAPLLGPARYRVCAADIQVFSPSMWTWRRGRPWVLLVGLLCRADGRRGRDDCLGAPYLLVTFHGGFNPGDVNTVLKYSRDGCRLGEAIDGDSELLELRGMVSYGPSLIVANAYQYESFVMQYGGCGSGAYKELRTLVPLNTEGLVHPYGLATDDRYLYVTNQGTNSVQRFELTTGHAGPLSPAMLALVREGRVRGRGRKADEMQIYHGQFAQLDPESDGVRGIATVPEKGLIFVADKDQGLVVLDSQGNQQDVLGVKQPIGVAYCKDRGTIFVGSKKTDNVYEYSVDTFERLAKYKSHKLSHPAGMVCHEDTLFVISQNENLIVQFDLRTGQADVVVDDLPDVGEHLALTPDSTPCR